MTLGCFKAYDSEKLTTLLLHGDDDDVIIFILMIFLFVFLFGQETIYDIELTLFNVISMHEHRSNTVYYIITF